MLQRGVSTEDIDATENNLGGKSKFFGGGEVKEQRNVPVQLRIPQMRVLHIDAMPTKHRRATLRLYR